VTKLTLVTLSLLKLLGRVLKITLSANNDNNNQMIPSSTFSGGKCNFRLVIRYIQYRHESSDSVVKTTAISLHTANNIANAAIYTAKQKKFNPITVTVVDPAGEIITMQRMDHCSSGAYPKYSFAKAFTAVSHNISSRAFRDKYIAPATSTDCPDYRKLAQLLNMVSINEGKLATFPGGIVLRSKEDGSVIGAVGVSGASGDEDEYCALEGAKAAGFDLITEPATR